jgi:hypothetical protein
MWGPCSGYGRMIEGKAVARVAPSVQDSDFDSDFD